MDQLLQCLTFGINVITLIFLFIYVWKTWNIASSTEKSVNEIKQSRIETSRPNVAIYLEQSENSSFLYLIIKNFGTTSAYNLKIIFEPKIISSRRNLSERLSPLFDEISYLAPNQEIRTFFGTTHELINDETFPKIYKVSISYKRKNPDQTESENFSLNLNYFRGIGYLGIKDLDDLVKVMETSQKELKSISSNINSLKAILQDYIKVNTINNEVKNEDEVKNEKESSIEDKKIGN